MNMLNAFKETVALAKEREMTPIVVSEGTTVEHFEDMLTRITPSFSEAKLGRWLGWIQGVLVAQGYASLEEMKQINRRNA